jgi:hypothetical protein
MESRVDPIAREVDAMHRRAAEAIVADTTIVAEAANVVRRWIEAQGGAPHPVLLEWRAVLDMLSPQEIAEFLVSRAPRAQRLRSSSPFLALARSRGWSAT